MSDFSCPHCGRALSAVEHHNGSCHGCGKSFQLEPNPLPREPRSKAPSDPALPDLSVKRTGPMLPRDLTEWVYCSTGLTLLTFGAGFLTLGFALRSVGNIENILRPGDLPFEYFLARLGGNIQFVGVAAIFFGLYTVALVPQSSGARQWLLSGCILTGLLVLLLIFLLFGHANQVMHQIRGSRDDLPRSHFLSSESFFLVLVWIRNGLTLLTGLVLAIGFSKLTRFLGHHALSGVILLFWVCCSLYTFGLMMLPEGAEWDTSPRFLYWNIRIVATALMAAATLLLGLTRGTVAELIRTNVPS